MSTETWTCHAGCRVAVWGAGGHGLDIASTLPNFVGFYDDDPARNELPGPVGDWELLAGVNNPQARCRLVQGAAEAEWHDHGRWIHPRAELVTQVSLGDHTHVHAGAFLTRCTVGDFCTIAPNATVLGDVTIGDRVLVGANATVRNLVRICSDVVIGAGAVVTKDISQPGVYVGSPARPMIRLTSDGRPYSLVGEL